MKPNWRNEVDPEIYEQAQASCPMGHNGELYAPCDPCLKKAILDATLPKAWESKWLVFEEVLDTGKTKVWQVRNRESGFVLGSVKWWGAFRKYTFFPRVDTVYDAACLYDVAHFMQLQMNERKTAKTARKVSLPE